MPGRDFLLDQQPLTPLLESIPVDDELHLACEMKIAKPLMESKLSGSTSSAQSTFAKMDDAVSVFHNFRGGFPRFKSKVLSFMYAMKEEEKETLLYARCSLAPLHIWKQKPKITFAVPFSFPLEPCHLSPYHAAQGALAEDALQGRNGKDGRKDGWKENCQCSQSF